MTDTNKQITSDALADAGKAPPLQGLFSTQAEAQIPTRGLILSPPFMAESVIEGQKSLIVKSRAYEIANEPFILLSQRKALGIIALGEQEQLTDQQFEARESEHLISKATRAEWCEAQPSWCKGPLYAWKVNVIEKFDKPVDTDVEVGPQVVVNDVSLVTKRVVNYFGNLDRFASKILPLFPKHTTYVECFCGRGEMIWHKEASEKEVLSDLDEAKIFCLDTARKLSADDLKGFEWTLKKTHWDTLAKMTDAEVKKKGDAFRFYRWIYLLSASRLGTRFSGGMRTTSEGRTIDYARRLKAAQRLKDVTIEQNDYKAAIKKYDSENTLFFVDPPYPDKQNDYYTFDCPDVAEIAETFKNIKGSVIMVIQGTDKQLKPLIDNYSEQKFKWPHPISNFDPNVSAFSIGRIFYSKKIKSKAQKSTSEFRSPGEQDSFVTKLNALTPVQERDGVYLKRDDLFMVNGASGCKNRSMVKYLTNRKAKGLIGTSSRVSAMGPWQARVAEHLGIPCRIHYAKSSTLTPEQRDAKAHGAEIVQWYEGFTSQLVSEAKKDLEKRKGWAMIPFGVDCEERIESIADQCANLPYDKIKRIVVPVGSGIALVGILRGLEKAKKSVPVLGVRVGSKGAIERIQSYVPDYKKRGVELSSVDMEYTQAAKQTEFWGLQLDPYYEAKVAPCVKKGDLFWLVGLRPSFAVEKSELAEKIEDVENYDESKATDAQLRDDFRIVLAWYATWKRSPDAFKYDLETIEKLLRKIVKELVRRGPDVIRFNPRGMAASVRSFFQRVAREVRVPQAMYKALKLAPDTDPEKLTAKELDVAHKQLHELFSREAQSQQAVEGWSTEDIVNLHARLVDRMYQLGGGGHPPPPDNGLDELSADFERFAEKQPQWWMIAAEKLQKSEYAEINRSGDKQGPVLKLEDVLQHFKTFKMRRPYVSLVGGLANHGETEGDIDILVNDTAEMPEWMKDVIAFRIGRALPAEIAKRVSLHFDRERGPFTNHVELYDLHCERVNPTNEIKEMRDASVSKALTGEMKSQAESAKREDKLTLGEFFYQPKPTRPAAPEQLQSIESLRSLYDERAEKLLPTLVQKKFDGARHQIHVDGDTVRIFSEDGDDNTARLPKTIEELKKLKVNKLVLDAEIERWDGKQHLPREAAAGYLNSKGAADDGDMITNVFDVLYYGDEGDIHKQPVSERVERLKKLGVAQSTMGAPDLKHRLNAVPGETVEDLEELERAVRKIRELPGSEGVVNKQVESEYPLEQVTPDTWIKFHNATTINGIVYGSEKTKGGVWVYQYGVLPGREKPAKTVDVKGKKIVPVGDTFATKRDYSDGDVILVEAETVNVERSPDGVSISAWVPRVIGDAERGADTVDSVATRARRNLVLQEKDVDEKGEVTYRPTQKVEKQQDPYLHVPPETKRYRYSVQHHWRGKSFHADLRLELKPKQLLAGWTMNTQIAGAVKEPVTSLSQAQAHARSMDKISKINWNTGEWATRPKAGTDKLVRAEILSERKAPEPYAWLDVEGKTKNPEPGKAPPVGGTRQFPGVFDIVDEGEFEYGAQKPWFHEYFFHGKGLNYRMFFRLLKISKRDEAQCEACGTIGVAKSLSWEGEDSETVLCDKCVDEFVQKQGVVLPPSEEQPMKDAAAWLAIYPDDQMPYVLDSDAVKKGWMPTDGYSALPAAMRKQIPSEYRYWTKRGDKAKQLRDELVQKIADDEVKIDVEAVYKIQKASMLDADFVLQEQTWRGPIQVRVGPSRTRWWVRIDVGRPELIAIDLQRNPLDNKQVAAHVSKDRHKASMKLSGDIAPGHYLNPTKETPSNIEILDSGKAEVLSLTDDLVKVQFKGDKLKGIYTVKRNNSEHLWESAQAAPSTKEVEKQFDFELYIPFDHVEIRKSADGTEKRLVTGIVLEPDVVDAQNDYISADAIEEAAHNFLREYNKSTEMGLMHNAFGDIGIELVECSIAPIDFTLGNKPVKKGSWLVTVHVTDDKRWEEVKTGKLNGFSVGGVATVAG